MPRPLAVTLRAVTFLAALAWHAATTAVATGTSSETVVLRGGATTMLLPLTQALQNQAINVRLLGWSVAGEHLQSGLPAGLQVIHPTALAPAATPLLPLIVREVGPEPVPPALTLVFLLRGDRAELRVPVSVIAPGQARFTITAPAEVVGRPEQALQIPVRVINTGTAPGRAELTFEGAAATAPAVSVPAGKERTVHVTTTAPQQGSRELRIVAHGGHEIARATIRLTSTDVRRSSGLGLATMLTGEARATLGAEGPAAPSGKGKLQLDGNLSRTTRLRATIAGDLEGSPDATFALRYRATTLELADASSANPAGSVGRGLYVSQDLRIPLLDTLSMAAAMPLGEGGERSPRFGVRVSHRRLRAGASLDAGGGDPRGRIDAGMGRLQASAAYRPDDATWWEARLAWAHPGVNLAAGYERAPDLASAEGAHEAWVTSRLPLKVPGVGRLTFSVRLELRDWALHQLGAGLDGDDGYLHWRRTTGADTVEAGYEAELGLLGLELSGHLPLATPASGWGRVDANVPLGPNLLRAGATVSGTGTGNFRVGATHQRLVGRGLLSLDAELEADNALADPALASSLGAGYAHPGGWEGRFQVGLPLFELDRADLQLSLTHRRFLATPTELAGLLDGPDPTKRQLTVLYDDGAGVRPLMGVRVEGCGGPEITDADGRVVLRGPSLSCRVRLDAGTLPVGALVPGGGPDVAPGDDAVLEVLATATVHGRVRYVDPATGEPLVGGPKRTVRVQFEGPEERWIAVTMPAGQFVTRGLPVGAYTAQPAGGPSREFTLTGAGAELELSLPGPERIVLDPSRVTPPVTVALTSMVVPANGELDLRVTSPGEVVRVEARLGDTTTAGEPRADGDWTLRVPVLAGIAGAQLVTVEVEFQGGSVASRSVQAIVTPATDPPAIPNSAGAPAELPPPIPSTGRTASADTAAEPPVCPTPVANMVRLPESGAILDFHVPTVRVPPGVTIALYVSAEAPMRSARALNVQHLASPRRWRDGDRHVWQVLTVVPYNEETDTTAVPIRVAFEDGTIVERVVRLTVDSHAPIPAVPGYNAPFPPSCRKDPTP